MRNDKDAEIASLRAELAESEDWIRILEQTHKENNRLADERRHAAARQDAETIARLREAVEIEPELSAEQIEQLTAGFGSILPATEIFELGWRTAMSRARAALVPRPGAANETDPKSRIDGDGK